MVVFEVVKIRFGENKIYFALSMVPLLPVVVNYDRGTG